MPFFIIEGVLIKYHTIPVAEAYITGHDETEVTVPDGVTSIGENAFYGFDRLTAIHIPDSVTSIGKRAFAECESLTDLHLPDSVTSIDERAFRDCTSLAEIRIPDSVTAIAYNAFQSCTAISVIRLRPDDPALRRNYGTVRHLGGHIGRVLNCFRNGNYDADINDTVKYPLLFLYWLHTHDEKLTAYIRDHMFEFMQDCIPAGDVCIIEAFTQEDGFFTAENIDRFITMAREAGKNEIFMILLNYKNMHFGFDNTNSLHL